MPSPTSLEAKWLSVIAKSLAYLCLSKAQEKDPEKFKEVLKRVEFLEGLGLEQADAAEAAGSSAASVAELRRVAKKRSGGSPSHGAKKNRR